MMTGSEFRKRQKEKPKWSLWEVKGAEESQVKEKSHERKESHEREERKQNAVEQNAVEQNADKYYSLIILTYNMWKFGKYQHLFGKPKEGPHRFRIFNIAIVDVVLTLLLARFLNYHFFPDVRYVVVMFFTFILGIIMHRIFEVRTTIDKLLF